MSRLLRFCLAIFVIAGLAVGPLAAPAMAGAPHDGAAMSMADDMPCCPHDQAPADATKCPCMAMCLSHVVGALPPPAIGALRAARASRAAPPPSDVFRDSPGEAPPPRPPRVLVRPA